MSTSETTLRETCEEFERIEAAADAFEITVEGVPIWERIRLDVMDEVWQARDFVWVANEGSETPYRRYARGLWLGAKNLVVRNPFLAGDHDLLVWGHPRRKRFDDGTWWDIYFDYLHESFEWDYVHVELDFDQTHLTPARTERLRYLDCIKYGSGLLSKIGPSSPSLPPSARDRLTSLQESLEAAFGAPLTVVNRAERELQTRAVKKPFYDRLLNRIDPEAVVLSVSYNKETFVEACKERSIPVVEYQHGMIDRYHFGYSYRGARSKDTFPDYLLTFGPRWCTDTDLPIPDERVIDVGYEHLERGVSQYADVASNEQVLFISGRSVSERLSEIAASFARQAPADVEVVYKLHPREYRDWRERMPILTDGSVTVVDSNDVSLYRLFAESSSQVGHISTAVFEGLRFGLTTFLVDHPMIERMAPLVENGDATLISDAADLVAALDSGTEPALDPTKYFTPEPLARFQEAMATISGPDGSDLSR